MCKFVSARCTGVGNLHLPSPELKHSKGLADWFLVDNALCSPSQPMDEAEASDDHHYSTSWNKRRLEEKGEMEPWKNLLCFHSSLILSIVNAMILLGTHDHASRD